MSRFRKGTESRASGERPEVTVESASQEFLASHRRKGSRARYLEELASHLIGAKRNRWLPLLPWAIAHEVAVVHTALRCGELCSLRVEDVRFDRREVEVRAPVSKNKSARVAPMNASVPALRRYLKLRNDSTRQTEAFFLPFYSTPVFAGGSERSRRRAVKSLLLSASPLTRVGH
jgi:integrase